MKYNSYVHLGEEALREGKYNDAANLLTKAYDLEPSNVEVLLNLGLSLYHLNRNKIAASMSECVKCFETNCRIIFLYS